MNRSHLLSHVFSKYSFTIVALFLAASASHAQAPTEIFISEYVEGSSFNKAVELFNGTGGAIDLGAGGYDVQIFFNGSPTAGQTIALTGTVANGDVFVLANSSADPAILATADQTTGSVSFNGDDAVVLRKSGAVIDAIGQVGFDPGSEWSGGGIGTQNETIRRKQDVCAGDTNEADAFDPSVEWDGFAQDTFDGLGSHVQSCTGPVVPTASALLLTEVVVTPTAGEFIEIHNPTGSSVDLSLYYLTDATFAPGGVFYYNIVTGVNAGGGSFSDFHARFPDGASIAPGEYQTVAMAGSDDFFAQYGLDPTYELYEDGAGADAVPDMREALPGSINNEGGLTNSGEVAVLYFWDGDSDLVTDVDYAVWGDKDEAVDKTGVSIDGPDADSFVTAYQADTAIPNQDVISGGGHASGDSFQRIDLSEGTETGTGGNGVGGNDETSENLSVTWSTAAATPGAPVPPPPVVAIVINEIIQNPAVVSDNNGEWFELFNATSDPVDIDGWTIKDNGSNNHVIANGGPLVIAPGGFLVLGRDANTGANGGVIIDYQYANIFLGNGSDALILLDTASSEVDRVEWDNGATFPDPNGASMALKFPGLDNNVGANWCESQTPFGDGDRGTPGAANDCLAGLVINEVDADDAGGDDEEFIELYDGGDGNTDLSGLVVVLYNGSDDASYNAFDLDGLATDADGFFVICGDAAKVANCDLDVSPSTNLLQNGADAVALHAGDASDFPNDTPVTTDGLLDAVVYDTNDGDDAALLVLLNGGQPQVNEDGEDDKDFDSNQRCPNGFGGQRNTDTYLQATPTAGALNQCPALYIYSIQGAGTASPYAGFTVGVEGGVVTALAADGFFMQMSAAASDGDPDTSDGIFVFTGAAPGVAVGDLVDVVGEVTEFFGLTEFGFGSSVTVTGSGALPAPVMFGPTVPSPDPDFPSCALEFECYEGMLVQIADGTVTGPNQRFGTDPIAEVHITAAPARTFREPGIEYPGLMMPPIPTWDSNPEVFELDPDKLDPLLNQIIPAGSSFSATGVLGFEFGGYELWPTELTVDEAPLPVPVRPRAPGELTVGSLNLFRLFDDFNDPVDPDGRNDDVRTTAEYNRRLAKFSAYIREVLDAPDILAVQEAEKLGVLEDLAALIELDDPSVVYSAYLEEGNDVGTIDVGFLVRDHIIVDAITQLGKDETFFNPVAMEDNILHDRPPLLLEGSCELEFGSFPIAVMTVHNRSLNDIDDATQGPRVRKKRLLQAESIAMKVQALQDADPGIRLVVLGDFNAFEFTDGYVDALAVIAGDFDPFTSLVCSEVMCAGDLVEPNLDNQTLWLPQEQRYSFIFRGNAQALDHALTSQGLAGEISGVEYGRGNADAAVDLINDDGTVKPLPLRASDHDGLVVFINKDEDADGVPNDMDMCPGTMIPEGVPTHELGTNRWALTDGDGVFDTNDPKGKGPKKSFTVGDTAGCSCEQIIDAQGLGNGHTKFGCSNSAMEDWIALVNHQ